MITRETYNRIDYLINLRRVTTNEVVEIETFIRKFNPKYSVCKKCGAQIKHGQRILKNWLEQQEIIDEVLKTIEPNPEPQLVTESNFDGDVDIVEADKQGCTKCGGRKKKTTEVTTTKTTRKPRTKK